MQLPDTELTLIREALTPPTADEVCGKITKFINGLGFVEEKNKCCL